MKNRTRPQPLAESEKRGQPVHPRIKNVTRRGLVQEVTRCGRVQQ